MARVIWSVAISFGLINIPVKLYSAISQKSVRFNQLDPTNNARIRNRKVNAETGDEVDTSELVRGFEVTKGNYVIVTDDDLAALAPKSTNTIDLEEFVELDLIDAKASGAQPAIEAPTQVADDVVVDLMAALEKSVAEAKESRVSHPTAGEVADAGSESAPAKKSLGKKASKKTAKSA